MKPFIIDAASFCSQPFPSPEANYTALLSVCAKLLKRNVTFMCMVNRAALDSYSSSQWSLRLRHFTSAYPFWFFIPLKGSDIVQEIRRASVSLNARIISARFPLLQEGSTQFDVDSGSLWLRCIDLRVGLGQPLAGVVDQVNLRLLREDRYKRHIVAEAAAVMEQPQLGIAA